jgi:hypothetical protein
VNFPVIVDVGIGLIVVYISVPLMVSGVQEAIASLFRWRSHHLRESILQIMLGANLDRNELDKARKVRDTIYAAPLIQSMNHTSVFWGVELWKKTLHALNYLLKGKQLFHTASDGEDVKRYKQLYSRTSPSYIDNETFATALIDTVCRLSDSDCKPEVNCKLINTTCKNKADCKLSEDEKNEKLKKREELQKTLEELQNFLRKSTSLEDEIQDVIKVIEKGIKSNENLPKSLQDILTALMLRAVTKVKREETVLLSFQKEIENWFDSSMDRASGVYKRNTQVVNLILATILVIFFNLDSLNIAQKLLNDSTLRTILVNNAGTLVANYKIDSNDPNSQIDPKKLEENINQVFDHSLPILPIYENSANFMDCSDQSNCPLLLSSQNKLFNSRRFFLTCIGWMLTILAIYMGAPFWFDLLNKVVNLRSTGSPPK